MEISNSYTNRFFPKDYLPHNFLAEKIILSSLLLDSDVIESVCRILKVEAFYFKNHQEIYNTIIFMYEKEHIIDIFTLTSFIQDNGLLQKIGGLQVILELGQQIPTLIYLEEYIRLINDKFLRRSLIKLGYEIINSAYLTNQSSEKILQDFEMKLFSIIDQTSEQEVYTSTQLLNNIFCDLKKKFLTPTLPGLSSGFSDLDNLTQGFQRSDLIIIAGRPSMGKTALSLNITLNIVKQSRLPVLFFTLEMSKEQIMYRLLAIESNISQTKLKNGKFFQNDWLKLNKIIKILSKLPIFINDSSNLSIQEIHSIVKKVYFEHKEIGIIIIDYLQLIQTTNTITTNRAQELSQITKMLKSLAREFNIPVIALSQLSRNIEARTDQRPILSDLRESGSIEQDADLVLMLFRNKSIILNESTSKLTDLIISKQRNGPTGAVQLSFDEQQTSFTNPI
jgi:replicative DNA helicase